MIYLISCFIVLSHKKLRYEMFIIQQNFKWLTPENVQDKPHCKARLRQTSDVVSKVRLFKVYSNNIQFLYITNFFRVSFKPKLK